jgi:hypothetical protein
MFNRMQSNFQVITPKVAQEKIRQRLVRAGCLISEIHALRTKFAGGWMVCVNLRRPRITWPRSMFFRQEEYLTITYRPMFFNSGSYVELWDTDPADPARAADEYRISGLGNNVYVARTLDGMLACLP